MNNEPLLKWIADRSRQVELLTSVCTGALLLGKAGLLDGKRATTHWRSIDWFYRNNMRILPDWKFSWLGGGITLLFFLCLNVMVSINTRGLAATDGQELIGYPFAFYIHGGFGGWTFILWIQLLIDVLIISSATIFAGCFFARKKSFSRLIIFLIAIFVAVRVSYVLFPGF